MAWALAALLLCLSGAVAPEQARAQTKLAITGTTNNNAKSTGAAVTQGFTLQTQNASNVATSFAGTITITFTINSGVATLASTDTAATITEVSRTSTQTVYTDAFTNANTRTYSVTYPAGSVPLGSRTVAISDSVTTDGPATALTGTTFNAQITQTIVWDFGAGTNVFNTAENWSPDQAPGPNFQMRFGALPAGSPQAISVSPAVSVFGIDFQTGGWSLSGDTISGTSPNGSVGNSDFLDFNVADQGTVTINNNIVNQFASQSNSTTTSVASGNRFVWTGGQTRSSSSFTKDGAGTLRFEGGAPVTGGDNSFGFLFLNGGTIELAKTAGINAVGDGNVFVRAGTMRLINPDQIPNSGNASTIRLSQAGAFDLNNNNETATAVAFANSTSSSGNQQAGSNGGGTVTTGTGTLTLSGAAPIVYGDTRLGGAGSVAVSGGGTTALLSGNVVLSSGGNKTLFVDNGTATPDLNITASISASPAFNETITKTGAGMLQFAGAAGSNALAPLSIGNGEVRLGANEQLGDTKALSLNGAAGSLATFNLNGRTETVGALTAANNNSTFATVLGAGVLNAGSVTLNGVKLLLTAARSANVSNGQAAVLINNTGANPVGGTFDALAEGDPVTVSNSGLTVNGTISYTYDAATGTPGAGNDVAILVTGVSDSLLVTTAADTVAADSVTSLREAITAANALTGGAAGTAANPAAITFAIPKADAGYSAANGYFTIAPVATALPVITASNVFLDATSQTRFTGDDNANGPEVFISNANSLGGAADSTSTASTQATSGNGRGLAVSGSNVTIAGVAVGGFNSGSFSVNGNSVDFSASGIVVLGGINTTGFKMYGCYLGVQPNGTTSAPNTVGLQMNPSGGNNTFLHNFTIGAPTFTASDGSTVSGRNVIAGNGNDGIASKDYNAVTIQNNYIGVNRTGDAQLRNVGSGIRIDNSHSHLIGGASTSQRNVISGNGSHGIFLLAAGNDVHSVRVLGNFIGTASSGTAAPTVQSGQTISGNNGNGIFLDSDNSKLRDSQIGGVNAGEANVIAFNNAHGIFAEPDPRTSGSNTGAMFGFQMRGNSIYNNALLGINLGAPAGAENAGNKVNVPQDAGDGDSGFGNYAGSGTRGTNGLQNFPVLSSARIVGDSLIVSGTFNSIPNRRFDIDVYRNDVADPNRAGAASGSGYGEGKVFVGTFSLQTNASGDAFQSSSPDVTFDASGSTPTFSATFASPAAGGNVITSAATYSLGQPEETSDGSNGSNGDTSEFSQAVAAVLNSPPTDISLSPSSVSEDAPSGTVVGTLTATDADAGDTFTFTLLNDASVPFAIGTGANANKVVTDGPLDPALTSYVLQVRVTDSAGAPGFTKNITVTLIDVDTAGAIITEFRFLGPNGSTDEYVEIYNTLPRPLNVGGWKLKYRTAAPPAALASVSVGPNTQIPVGGHLLFAGTAYNSGDLSGYGGTGAALGDVALAGDALNNSGAALLNASDGPVDAVGFTSSDAELREGDGLEEAPSTVVANEAPGNVEFAFVRDRNGLTFKNTVANSTADFVFVSTSGGTFNAITGSQASPGTGTKTSILGAPGPENRTSPSSIRLNQGLTVSVLDSGAGATAPPNRVRTQAGSTPVANQTKGTILLRRRITNSTGAPVTKLRFRAVRITTKNAPPSGQADVRLLSSSNESAVSTSGGPKQVFGTTLEDPPAQASGGGLNSSVIVGTVTMASPLPSGPVGGILNSRNVSFLLGVEEIGTFNIVLSIEAVQ